MVSPSELTTPGSRAVASHAGDCVAERDCGSWPVRRQREGAGIHHAVQATRQLLDSTFLLLCGRRIRAMTAVNLTLLVLPLVMGGLKRNNTRNTPASSSLGGSHTAGDRDLRREAALIDGRMTHPAVPHARCGALQSPVVPVVGVAVRHIAKRMSRARLMCWRATSPAR